MKNSKGGKCQGELWEKTAGGSNRYEAGSDKGECWGRDKGMNQVWLGRGKVGQGNRMKIRSIAELRLQDF